MTDKELLLAIFADLHSIRDVKADDEDNTGVCGPISRKNWEALAELFKSPEPTSGEWSVISDADRSGLWVCTGDDKDPNIAEICEIRLENILHDDADLAWAQAVADARILAASKALYLACSRVEQLIDAYDHDDPDVSYMSIGELLCDVVNRETNMTAMTELYRALEKARFAPVLDGEGKPHG